MGRRKKTFDELPTKKMRGLAWSRDVKQKLLPGTDPAKPYANRIDEAIKKLIKEAKGLQKQALERYWSSSNDRIVSSGRWQSWWMGREQPTPKKIELFALLFPGTQAWFSSGMPEKGQNHLLSLFHAVDLWASELESSDKAMQLLVHLGKTWRPKNITERTAKSNQQIGWYIEPFYDKRIPSEIAMDHYRSLEPSSLIESMIWSGYFFKVQEDPELFIRWILDLVIASLATKTLLQEVVGDEAALSAGKSGDVMGFVLEVFIYNSELYLAPETADRSIKYLARLANGVRPYAAGQATKLPLEQNFLELVLSAAYRFDAELTQYGISVDHIRALDRHLPCFRVNPD
ncbi:MAG: hypothetical protein WC100_13425 [Sterolibacterium sp.]